MTIWNILIVLLCLGFGFLFCLIMFWTYGLTPILHWYIKSGGLPGKAVIQEAKHAGWGWYSGNQGTSLDFRPMHVRLEVRPENGAPYIAYDRLNVKARYLEYFKPGNEIQVVIANFSPAWVASLPETAVEPKPHYEHVSREPGHSEHIHAEAGGNPKARLEQLKQMLDGGLISQEDYEKKKAEVLARM